jgi:hypothetical protein
MVMVQWMAGTHEDMSVEFKRANKLSIKPPEKVYHALPSAHLTDFTGLASRGPEE